MTILERVEHLKQASRKGSDTVDPQLFKVLAVLLGQELSDSPDFKSQYHVINKVIADTIGPGHSLISCGQFIEGKKGREVIIKNKEVIELFFKSHRYNN